MLKSAARAARCAGRACSSLPHIVPTQAQLLASVPLTTGSRSAPRSVFCVPVAARCVTGRSFSSTRSKSQDDDLFDSLDEPAPSIQARYLADAAASAVEARDDDFDVIGSPDPDPYHHRQPADPYPTIHGFASDAEAEAAAEASAAARGVPRGDVAVHGQEDPDAAEDDDDDDLVTLIERGEITLEELAAVDPQMAYALTGSGLGKLSPADFLRRATGAVMGLPLNAVTPWEPARRRIIPMPPGVPADAVAAVRAFERRLPFRLHENTTRVLGLPKSLGGFGFQSLTPVQMRTIPALVQGLDVLVRAPTGTGKTLSFLVPLLERLLTSRTAVEQRRFSAVIVAPTRELALQIAAEAEHLLGLHGRLARSDYRVATLVGGGPTVHEDQQPLMSSAPAIVVGTPGRIAAHLRQTPGFAMRMKGASMLVLDEVDYLLALGFKNDLTAIVASLKPQRQTLMFSATLSPAVRLVAHHALRRSHEVIDLVADPRGTASAALKAEFEAKMEADQRAHAAAEAAEGRTGDDARPYGLEGEDEFAELDEEDDWAGDAAATVRKTRAEAKAAARAAAGEAPAAEGEEDEGLDDVEEEEDPADVFALAHYEAEMPVRAQQVFSVAPLQEQLPLLARLLDDVGGRFRFARAAVLDEIDAARAAAAEASGSAARADDLWGDDPDDPEYAAQRAKLRPYGNAPIPGFNPSQHVMPIPGAAAGAESSLWSDDESAPPKKHKQQQKPYYEPEGAESDGFETDSGDAPDVSGLELPKPPKIVVFMPTARMAQFAAAVFRRVVRLYAEPKARGGMARQQELENARRGAWSGIYELHSRKSQNQRVRAVEEFGKMSRVNGAVLFCSDVASRGLDFDDVDLVIQFGIPPSRNQYIHRVGRTARAGKAGRGLLVVAPFEEEAARSLLAGVPLGPPDLESVDMPSLEELTAKTTDAASEAPSTEEFGSDDEDEMGDGQELWEGVIARACAPLHIPADAPKNARTAIMEELRGQTMNATTGDLYQEDLAYERTLARIMTRVLRDEELGLHADRAWISWLGLHRVRRLRSSTGDVLSVQLESVKRPRAGTLMTPQELLPHARAAAESLGLIGPWAGDELPALPPSTAAKLGVGHVEGYVVGEPRKWERSEENGSRQEKRGRWGRRRSEAGQPLEKRTLMAQRRDVMKGSDMLNRPERGRTGEVHYKWHA